VRSGPPAAIATYAVALTAMLLAAAIDSVEQRLPNVLTIGGSIFALAGFAATELLGDESDWWRAVIGGAIFACWILAAALIVPGSYGLGDVKLAVLCGILLAWHSWPALAGGMIATQIAIAATLLAARRRRKKRASLGPSFAAGTLFALAVAVL
jgi:leader peptidase (prepilin peptidase)/N-methyltransferase